MPASVAYASSTPSSNLVPYYSTFLKNNSVHEGAIFFQLTCYVNLPCLLMRVRQHPGLANEEDVLL